MYHVKMPASVALTGLLLLISGTILMFAGLPVFINYTVKKGVVLENGTEAMSRWQKPPPLDFKVYFFNVTNPDEVNSGQRPILKEMGPYVYTEYHDKEIIQFHEQDDTVSYSTRKKFFYNQRKSQCRLETDRITLINPALMGTVLMVERMFPLGLGYINNAIPYLFPNQKTVFTTATVHEFLFGGIILDCSDKTSPSRMVCEGMKGRIPVTIRQLPNSPNYAFSFFNHKNDSLVGPFRISRGRKNATNLGKIISYEGKYELDTWPDNSTCNVIRGTDSTIFPPFMKKSDMVYIFVPDVCGSMFAEFDKMMKVDDISVLKFVGSSKNFADPNKNSDNKCHCDEVPNKGEIESDEPELVCPKEGAMYLSACYKAPIVFSQPHFYKGDKEYQEFPEGLHANKSKHETFVQIEPKTGVPVEGFKRLQMNMEIRSLSSIDILANVSSGLLPILWIEEGLKLDGVHIANLTKFYRIIFLLKFVSWFLLVSGVCMFILAIVLNGIQRDSACPKLKSSNKIKSVRQYRARASRQNGTMTANSDTSQNPSEFVRKNSIETLTITTLTKLYPYRNKNGDADATNNDDITSVTHH